MILNQIPLLNDTTDQTLDVSIEDTPYTLRVLWNEKHKYFSLSISEIDGFILLENIKLVNNFALVQRFRRLAFKGELFFVRKDGKDLMPTDLSDLDRFALYYYDAETPVNYPALATVLGASQTVWDDGFTIWRDEFGNLVNWI